MQLVVRKQIHLAETDVALLERAARASGATHSELVRRAIRDKYGAREERSLEERRANLMALAGIWKDRKFTGEEYVRAIRSGDMNANLRRLGVG